MSEQNTTEYNDFLESYGRTEKAEPSQRIQEFRMSKKMLKTRMLSRLLLGLTAVVIIVGVILFCITLTTPKPLNGGYTQIVNYLNDETAVIAGYPKTDLNTKAIGSAAASPYAIVIDADENKIIASKNPNEKIYPASMTKIMTLLVACENITDTSASFTMTNEIIDPLYKQGATTTGLKSGETVPIIDILYGIALPSGADAAVAAAIYVSGSETEFVKLMNSKAEALGITNTHFSNVTGMDAQNHYTTVNDMSVITRAAMNNELCRNILSSKKYTTSDTDKNPGGISFESGMFSKMTGSEPEKVTVLGGKTGFTDNALYCLASFAVTDDGKELICVTAKGQEKYDPIYDAIKLYTEYGYPDEQTESDTSSETESEN